MRFAIFRHARQGATDGLPLPPDGAGVTLHERATLGPADEAFRVSFTDHGARVSPGSFVDDRTPLTHLAIAEADSRDAVVAWLRTAPADGAAFDVRDSGCAGGLPGVDPTATATKPRFAVFVRADADTESETSPGAARLAAMAQCNDDAVRRGSLLAADGLRSTARATRLRFDAGRAAVTDGPFAEAKELVAGFWLLQADSIGDVVDWVRRYPYAQDRAEVEVRPVVD